MSVGSISFFWSPTYLSETALSENERILMPMRLMTHMTSNAQRPGASRRHISFEPVALYVRPFFR